MLSLIHHLGMEAVTVHIFIQMLSGIFISSLSPHALVSEEVCRHLDFLHEDDVTWRHKQKKKSDHAFARPIRSDIGYFPAGNPNIKL